MNKTTYYLHQIKSLPPSTVFKKTVGLGKRKIRATVQWQYDFRHSTYADAISVPHGSLFRYFPAIPVENFTSSLKHIPAITNHFLAHRFDLLGSGWMQVKHGISCRGLEGYRYRRSNLIDGDAEGKWLEGRINSANLSESKRVWQLISTLPRNMQHSAPNASYVPIDWQLDFKSGYRWSETTWYKNVPFGHKMGVDIKVPWELARMQHLPQLAIACALAKQGKQERIQDDDIDCLQQPQAYVREFCHQVLDFIATNPPRFGVNWCCSMDVGIRIANWLVAYDLFKAYGAHFDSEFEAVFVKGVYEHGKHIIHNLEWYEELRGNHYLADIVGLLFVVAYLPCTPETDTWLAFAVQELIQEVERQFYPEGANFEASTSYHRLSSEMVIYATALILSLSEEKTQALEKYDHPLIKGKPGLKPPPAPLYPLPVKNNRQSPIANQQSLSPFPAWYFERLERMAEFSMHTTKPDNRIVQMGDNDSGRFLKLQPMYIRMTVSEAKKQYMNLKGYDGLSEDQDYWMEDLLEHRHLVAAINGLFSRRDFVDFINNHWYEQVLVNRLAGGLILASYHDKKASGKIQTPYEAAKFKDGSELCMYPDFGAYIFHSPRIYLVVRCGSGEKRNNGGHSHNDQLSFELAIDNIPLILDPGTYLYTPLPEKRNKFRSTVMHNTLVVNNMEQTIWEQGKYGLFSLSKIHKAESIHLGTDTIRCEYQGSSAIHRRTLCLLENGLEGIDECVTVGEKKVYFHLSRDLVLEQIDPNNLMMGKGKLHFNVSAILGTWSVHQSGYSSAYGVLKSSQVLCLTTDSEKVTWKITIAEDPEKPSK